MEQILARLLAEMNAIQERMEAKRDANEGKTNAWLEEMKAWQKETMACQEATEVCLEKTQAYLESKEPTPVEMASTAEHLAVSKQEAAVEKVRALEDRYGDRHLAVGHRRQPKKRTEGDGGSWQKFAAARGRLTRRNIPAPGKGRSSGTRQRQCCTKSP
jgi:hypothetical protein